MPDNIQSYTPAKIAAIKDIGEAVRVKEMADAYEAFSRANKAFTGIRTAQEYRLRAVRVAGIILLPPAQGGQTEREERKRTDLSALPMVTQYQQALEDAGISRKTANEWIKVARVEEEIFEGYLSLDYEEEPALTIAGLLKHAGAWYGRSSSGVWGTPQWLFDLLDEEFSFDLDVCANEENAKCKDYFTEEDDGLAQNWDGVCWMNPPYGREIAEWMTKARESAEAGSTVVCLVPARPDTDWWWENALAGEVRFIRGRLQWPDSETPAPFPSAVVVLSPDAKPGKVVWWDVRPR